MTSMIAIAIDWPAMFGNLNHPALQPAAKLASVEQRSASEKVIARVRKAALLAKCQSKSRETGGNDAFSHGQSTIRLGTVVFGNVTKRPYHRYWCTTRNW